MRNIILAALVLAGCTGGKDKEKPTPLPTPTPIPSPTATPIPSPSTSKGPPWTSGMFKPTADMARIANTTKWPYCLLFRGAQQTWNDIGKQVMTDFQNPLCDNYVFSMAPVPTEARGCTIWAEIADTDHFDAKYVQMAKALKDRGAPPNMAIRVGWEIDIGFPWELKACTTEAMASKYKAAFKKIVNILRSNFSPDVKIDWNVTKESGKLPLPLESYYPGNDAVDFITADYYDFWIDASTPEKFIESANRGTAERPKGLFRIYEFAVAHGRKFGVPEWGVLNQATQAGQGGDNPVYIDGMAKFFREHQDNLAYEIYFNSLNFEKRHLLGDDGPNPKSTEAYHRLWK